MYCLEQYVDKSRVTGQDVPFPMQKVVSYGLSDYMYYSSSIDKMQTIGSSGPVYGVNGDWVGSHSSWGATFRYLLGKGKMYPPVRHEPPK